MEVPGGKLDAKVIRLVYPKGYRTPLHTHEGPGPRYVVRGKIRIEESGQVHEYGPGETFWETGAWITAENVAEGETEIMVVELAAPK